MEKKRDICLIGKHEEEEVVAELDEGDLLVIRRALNSQKDFNDKQRKNIFHNRCTIQGKVCCLIIDSGSGSNVASTSLVEKLGLQTSVYPHLYNI